MRRECHQRLTPLQAVVIEVQRSVRRRVMFANVAGALAVITFIHLASGDALAPDLPPLLQVLGPVVPLALLVVPAYRWSQRTFSRNFGLW